MISNLNLIIIIFLIVLIILLLNNIFKPNILEKFHPLFKHDANISRQIDMINLQRRQDSKENYLRNLNINQELNLEEIEKEIQ